MLVIRIPRLRLPSPGLLDRYISRIYIRIAGLSFLALLGLFHISTFLDRSDKMFKGQATLSEVGRLLLYLTPQFVYYVIPISALLSVLVTFGLLSRNSELTVMKACGISLYRASLSVIVLSLVFSVAIFSLEQKVLAQREPQGRGHRRQDSRPPATPLRLPEPPVGAGSGRGHLSLLGTSTRSGRSWRPSGFISRRPKAGACAPRRRPSAPSTTARLDRPSGAYG